MFNNKWFRKFELLFLLVAFLFLQEATAQISGATNPVICSDGTAASPCYTFQSAVNKGFYSPTAGTIGISIGGVNVGTWSATGYSSPFAFTATSYFATAGSNPSPSTTGAQLWQSGVSGRLDLIDASRTANNRILGMLFGSGQMTWQFVNDAYGAGTPWLTVSGGQASGITGITSSSGSGSWVHTGLLAASAGIKSTAVTNTVPSFQALLPANATAIAFQTGTALTDGWKWVQDEVTTGDMSIVRRNASVDSTVLTIARASGASTFNSSVLSIGGVAPGVSVFGAQLWVTAGAGAHWTLVDSTRTANNRITDAYWNSGNLNLRFVNDADSLAITWLSVSGGQAGGITGIASNSGVGNWVHTGGINLSGSLLPTVDNTQYLGLPSFRWSALFVPTIDTGTTGYLGISTNNGVNQTRILHTAGATNQITLTGSNGGAPHVGTTAGDLALSGGASANVSLQTNNFATTQVYITDTASANRYITLTGSNGGNPTIGTSAGSLAITPNIVIAGTGPHAIGSGINSDIQLLLSGTLSGAVTNAQGFYVSTTLNVPANGIGAAVNISPTINKAGSGTHPDFAGLYITPPTIGAGAATLTNSTTLKITGPPTVGTNLRALWVANGVTETLNHRLTGFVFANIATNIPTNGDIGYCSDCTLANPCAGGGTGALAKRLNGVNVCN